MSKVNFSHTIIEILETAPDKVIFESREKNTSAREFRQLIFNIAHNMRSNGINENSLVLIETDYEKYEIATAMYIAVALLGASCTQLTLKIFDVEQLPITHIVSYSYRKTAILEEIEKRKKLLKAPEIKLVSINEEWFKDIKLSLKDFPLKNDENSIYFYSYSSGTSLDENVKNSKYMLTTYKNWWNIIDSVWKDYTLPKYANIYQYSTHQQTQKRIQANILNDIIFISERYYDEVIKKENSFLFGNMSKWRNKLREFDPPPTPYNITLIANNQKLSKEDVSFFKKYFKNVGTAYGCSEAGGRICSKIIDENNFIPGSVGKVMDYASVKIKDDDMNDLEDGKIGNVCIKWENAQTNGYINFPQFNKTNFVDGYVRPGDLGYFTKDKELVICGRIFDKAEVYNRKIILIDIENALSHTNGVKDLMVFVNELYKEESKLCVAIVPEDMNDVQTPINNLLQNYKKLKYHERPSVIYLAMSELPRTETFKARRKQAAELLDSCEKRKIQIYPLGGKFEFINKICRKLF